MRNPKSLKFGVGVLLSTGCMVWLVGSLVSCGTAPTPIIVQGPGQFGNDPPTLSFLEPNANITRGQGDPFLIRWTDRDSDDNAQISFLLENTADGSDRIVLVEGIDENDLTGPDAFTVGTTLIPEGTYNVFGIINDGTNNPVQAYAFLTGVGVSQRVAVTIVGPGEGPQTQPPTIAVTEPSFNLSVAQDDTLTVVVQPTLFEPDAFTPFDPDSRVQLYILLDTDLDPNNDNPANPDPSEIIVLRQPVIEPGDFGALTFEIPIDLSVIPPRPNGESYFIRASADDGTNPRVHQYAIGTINVVQLAAGVVDLFDIGRTKSGAKFYGFNPGANLGSEVAHVSDFDADGVDDFMLVAQFGNPRNVGTVGEAYLIYGQTRAAPEGVIGQEAGNRFGGSIPVNSVAETISGAIFEAPPIRRTITGSLAIPGIARTDGIVDVDFVRDLSGDGRPEILFGLPHVHGAFEGTDYDPGDEDLTRGDQTIDRELVFEQGLVTMTTGQNTVEVLPVLWLGIEDLTISTMQPNTILGSSDQLSWVDDGAGSREWVLIKFTDILPILPDNQSNIDITTVQGTIEFRVFNLGGGGTVHVVLTDFEERETFASFAAGGGAPQPGVDYEEDALGNIDGTTIGIVNVDISDLLQRLVDGELAAEGNELRFIIVPDPAEGADQTAVRSSEYPITEQRPKLTVEYTRINFLASIGCYPDRLVNNMTNQDAQGVAEDVQWFGGGMAIFFNSENRDNEPRFGEPPARLESTSVALELVGQETGPPHRLDGGGTNDSGLIAARADDYQDLQRIAGARFNAGGFDYIDHLVLNQPPREGLYGQTVGSIGDLNNDGLDEIIISAPTNERYREDLLSTYGFESTHWWSTEFRGSVSIIPGTNYNDGIWREKSSAEDGSSNIPILDQQRFPPFGRCSSPSEFRGYMVPADIFEVFAEDVDDMLGGASSAGDFNQDGLDDILCGAYHNDNGSTEDTGALYVLYGRNILGDFDLTLADDPILRPPMVRIRGVKPGDQIGWRQTRGLDVNGDRTEDIFFSSPTADYGGVARTTCARDANGDNLVNSADLNILLFNDCESNFGDYVFASDPCKVFDYNNDSEINDEDRCVFCCLSDDCEPEDSCVHGNGTDCCADLVDNGFVGIIFGGVFLTGDRDITQLANPITEELPGVAFYGSGVGHRAGADISSAGDFNQDGFGDLLITAPGQVWRDSAGRDRLGVVYLIFGGTHLVNTRNNLRNVGNSDLPGIVFYSPYVAGRPNEAAPTTVAYIGDINDDGFDDIAIGNPRADFIDLSFPQGPNAPGTDAAVGRRRDVGDVYVIYGNNFGTNRAFP